MSEESSAAIEDFQSLPLQNEIGEEREFWRELVDGPPMGCLHTAARSDSLALRPRAGAFIQGVNCT